MKVTAAMPGTQRAPVKRQHTMTHQLVYRSVFGGSIQNLLPNMVGVELEQYCSAGVASPNTNGGAN